jgi:hypothetical protein
MNLRIMKEKTFYHGASFAKNGSELCWGCGAKGMIVANCKNALCINKYNAKLARRKKTNAPSPAKGQQHFNPEETDKKDDVEGFEMFDKQDFVSDEKKYTQAKNAMNKVGDTTILLDSRSTHSTLFVRHLVYNICPAPCPLKMCSNRGGKDLQPICISEELWDCMI